MAIQQMGAGKIFLVCSVAAVLTFVATGIAIVLAGASRQSTIVIVAALVVLLVPFAKFVTETWKWLSWKEAKSSRSGSESSPLAVPRSREMSRRHQTPQLQQDQGLLENAPQVTQVGFVKQAPRSSHSVSGTVTTPTDAD